MSTGYGRKDAHGKIVGRSRLPSTYPTPPFVYSAQITIVAGYLNSSFPFHTEPDYEISGGFVDGMGQFNSIVGILDYVILQYLVFAFLTLPLLL